MRPTIPLVKGGRPGSGVVCSAETVSLKVSNGFPERGAPLGTLPTQAVSPSREEIIARLRTPTNE